MIDNKTRFFKSTILLQFILSALLGVFLYSKFQEQEILNIPELHPNEFNLGMAVPIMFFLIGCFLSLPYLFLKKKPVQEEEIDVEKKLRLKNFWKFSFYSNVFFLLVLLLFLAIVNFQHTREFILSGDEPFYLFVFFQALFVVLISLIVASFMLSSGVYWKTNKGLALITLVLGFAFFATWIYLEYVFIAEVKRMSDNYYFIEENPEQTLPEVAVEATVEESKIQQGDTSEDRGEWVEIEEAWNYFLNHKYDLKGKQEFTEVRFPMYSNFLLNTVDDGDYFLTGYVNEIRKDPAMISLAFDLYKDVLYNSVSRRTYRVANFDKVIDGLLFTYEDLTSNGNSRYMRKIFETMNAPREGYDLDADEYYPELERYFSPETIELLESIWLSNGSQFSNGDIVWLYSFWARRNNENNVEEVVAILREIKENYN